MICHISGSSGGGRGDEQPAQSERITRLHYLVLLSLGLMLFAGACDGSGEEPAREADEGTPAEEAASSIVSDGGEAREPTASTTTQSAPTTGVDAEPASTEALNNAEGENKKTEVGEVEPDEVAEAPHLPVTVVDHAGASVTVESIDRIIPLDGDIAEVVFALGLGDRVVATDLSATYPPEADDLPQIGYQRALSTEPIAAFEPTVLLATALAGPPETLDELRRLGFPLIIVPSEPTSQGPGMKIRAVASALGVPGRGEALAAEVENAIAETAAQTACGEDCPRVLMVYVRGTSAQLVFGESSPTRWLIEAAGGVDVSGELGVVDPTPISAEAIVSAAPDVLITTEAGLESVGGLDGLLEIPGLAGTPAGREGRVLTYDAQLLLGNGPRVADLLSQLISDLKTVSE